MVRSNHGYPSDCSSSSASLSLARQPSRAGRIRVAGANEQERNRMSSAARARELLQQALGAKADFHPGQLEAILALVDDRERVLVVQRTGWGKSLVQLREGRALSMYGDAGWGRLVRAGKYRDGCFSNELVEAVAEMLTRYWQPDVTPTWVTAVPSLRAAELVPDFARRLAARLGLAYRDALEKTVNTQPQKTMENSHHQALNTLGSFQAIPERVISEPVFLIDDMTDSRWSLTVCGVLLAEAGSGPVVPIALAEAAKGVQP